MKLSQGSALLLVALLAGIAACSARKNQQRPAQGATGMPVEMSSMAITFYNSGKCLVGLSGCCCRASRAFNLCAKVACMAAALLKHYHQKYQKHVHHAHVA